MATIPEGYVPTFHFDIVEKIKAATGAPLVLHGGSGAGEENMRRSVEAGINKINVGTDYMIAQREFVAKALAEKTPVTITRRSSRTAGRPVSRLSSATSRFPVLPERLARKQRCYVCRVRQRLIKDMCLVSHTVNSTYGW